MSGTSESQTVEEKVDYYASYLKSSMSTAKRRRLSNHLEDTPDAGPCELFQAWCGGDLVGVEDAKQQVENGTVPGFDPAEDTPSSGTIALITESYNRAVEEGMENEAAFLRVLEGGHQRGFATFLRQAFLAEGKLDKHR